MRDGLTGNLRKIAQELSAQGKDITVSEMADTVGVRTYRGKEKVRKALQELFYVGEMERLSPGVYRYVGRREQKPRKQKVMWRFFRMRKKCGACVTIEDLQAAADVTHDYAREWLTALIRLGIVKEQGKGRFQLLKDPVEMPANEKKAEKLRALYRQRKQRGLELIEQIQSALDELRQEIGGIEK